MLARLSRIGLPDILYRANGQKKPEIALSRRLARRC
jgi:hypothetical protein